MREKLKFRRSNGPHCKEPPFLVGALEYGFYDFPYIGNVIIPTDEVIFFRGVETTNQISIHFKFPEFHGTYYL